MCGRTYAIFHQSMYDCPHQGPFEPLRVDSIFYAAASVGGQPHIFVRFECGYPFDQADGPDGDQIVLVAGGGVIFF